MFDKELTFTAYGGPIWLSTSDDGLPVLDPTLVAGVTVEAGTSKVRGVPIGDGYSLTVRMHRVANKFLHVISVRDVVLVISPAEAHSGRTSKVAG